MDMPFRIDLHTHSLYSGDTDADPEAMVERAIETGLNGIAFTEHYSYEASEPMEALRDKYAGRLLIFRGVEFSASEGHCLVFGANTDRLSLKHAPADDLVRIVTGSGGVVIPSHPFRIGNSLGALVMTLRGITALEAYNGCNLAAYNDRAVEAARALRLPMIGGSDAHLPAEVGLCYTEFDDEVTDQNLIELLRRGGYRGIDARRGLSRAGYP